MSIKGEAKRIYEDFYKRRFPKAKGRTERDLTVKQRDGKVFKLKDHPPLSKKLQNFRESHQHDF